MSAARVIEPSSHSTLLPNRILVVDDREANRYATVHALTRAGFQVMEAASGREALELANQLPSAVVLDIKLPDILGYEVCRRIKANAHTSHIPVLQLSAFVSDESKVSSLESGADAYLTQPVEPNVLVATVRSLVRLHEAEWRARQSGEQWQATFDALTEGVALVDADGTIQRSNRALTQILGRSYVSIEGRSVGSLLHECFGIRIDGRKEFAAREAQVDTRYFRFDLAPIVIEEVQSGAILIVSEITDQKRAQTALLVNERHAATGRIAHTIAHEINNPLEAITNLLYLLEGALGTPELAAQYLESAEEQLSRVSRIVRQILSFNRETSAAIPVHIHELLEDVLALNNRTIVEKGVKIEKRWSGQTVIHGFPAQLRQVFSNLLRNAVEASMPGKTITIKISPCSNLFGSGEPGARVTLSDQGVGIPEQNRQRVFEAFFTTKELRGSGIGLWLSSTIVQEHHGRIQVRSRTTPGKSGTCISVLLPCSEPAAEDAHAPQSSK